MDKWTPRLDKESESWDEVGQDSTDVHMARFVESARSKKQPVEDGERGHNAAAAAHLVNESIRKGRALEWDPAAGAIKKAIAAVLKDGKVRTPDLGGNAKTGDVTKAVLGAL